MLDFRIKGVDNATISIGNHVHSINICIISNLDVPLIYRIIFGDLEVFNLGNDIIVHKHVVLKLLLLYILHNQQHVLSLRAPCALGILF